MLTPNKYSKIEKSAVVIGSQVLINLKKRPYNIEELYKNTSKFIEIDIGGFFNCLTFLFLLDLIEKKDHYIYLRGK